MKILFFSAYYTPHVGGYITNIKALAEGLKSRGHTVIVVTCRTDGPWPAEPVMVFRLPCWHLLGGTFPVPKPSRYLWGKLRWLWGWPDVVSTQTRFFPTSLLGWLFATLTRTPLVHTERGTQHSASLSPIVDALSRIYDHTLGALVIRQAHRRFGVSQAACEFSQHLSGRLAWRIPNGIDPEVFDGVRRPAGKRVAFVGRLTRAKGVQDLLKALPFVINEHEGLEVYVVGDGSYGAELRRMAEELPVTFTGEMTPQQVARLLRTSSVLVNPSYSEGLPTSVMEAAAMGLPVVATDVGGTREIVQDGVTGYLVKPDVDDIADAVCRVLRYDDMALEMGVRGRQKVLAEFDWGRIVETYERAFARACNATP